MEKYFRYDGVASSNLKDAKRIQMCKNLCKRLKVGYHDNVLMGHDGKWGSLEIKMDNHHMSFSRTKCITEIEKEKEAIEFKKAYEKEDYLQEQDLELLFTTMKKYVLGWWD
jgi:hypothetical protein